MRVGQLGFLSLKGLEWSIPRAPFKNRGLSTKAKLADREQASKSDQALRVTINSIGLRPGSSEGSRRQWIALRLDGVHIWVPKGHLRSPQPSDSLSDDSDFEASSSEASYRPSRARKISAASSTSQRSHFSHSDPKPANPLKTWSRALTAVNPSISRHLPPQLRPILRFLRKIFRLGRLMIIRPLLNKINLLGRRLSWIISIFGLEVNEIEVELNEVCRVKCSVKIGLQLSRGDQGKLCGWIVIKRLEIHKVITTTQPDPAQDHIRSEDGVEDPSTAFNFPGCIEISASAGLDPVIGLASIWAGTKPAAYPPVATSVYDEVTPSGSWKRYIRPRSVNVGLKISELPLKRRPSKKASLSPKLDGSSAFISIPNALIIMRSIPTRTQTDPDQSGSVPSDEPLSFSSNFPNSLPEGTRKPPGPVFSVFSIIRQFQISIPNLHCYHISTGNISSSTPSLVPLVDVISPRWVRMALSLHISRFLMNLDLSAERTGMESRQASSNIATHMEWFGRGASVPIRFDLGWKDLNINAALISDSEELSQFINCEPNQLLRMSEISCVLNSSWVPGTLRGKIQADPYFSSSASQVNFNRDHNESLTVAELEIGKIRGQMPIENLLILHELFRSKTQNSFDSKSEPPLDRKVTQVHHLARHRLMEAPKLVLGLTVQSIAYDFHGSTKLQSPTSDSPPVAESSNPSNHPSRRINVLSFGCSSFHFNSTGEYVDLTVKRSEAMRRAARTRATKNDVYVPISLRGIKISQAHEDSILLEKPSADTDVWSIRGEADDSSVNLKEEVNLKRSQRGLGPHPQAFPLPNPSLSFPQWKSRVEIFRKMSSVEFIYQFFFSFQTHSVNIAFHDGARFGKPRNPFMSFDLPSRGPYSGDYEFFNLKSAEIVSEFHLAGRHKNCFNSKPVPVIDLGLRDGAVQTFIEEISLDLWHPNLLACFQSFAQVLSNFRRTGHRPEVQLPDDSVPSTNRPVPIPQDVDFSVAVSKVNFRTAGFDPKQDPEIARGVKLEISNALIECFRQSTAEAGLYSFPHRSRLDLQEDIRVQANAQLVHNPDFDSCLMKCAMKSIKISPIRDLTGSLRSNRFSRHNSPSKPRMFHYQSPALWEDKKRFGVQDHRPPQSPIGATLNQGESFDSDDHPVSIFEAKQFTCRTTLQILKQPDRGEDELILAAETGLMTLHIDAFHIYCSLISISTLLNLFKSTGDSAPGRAKPRPKRTSKLPIGIRAEISRINCHMFLSHKVPIFIEVRRVSFHKSSRVGFDARWDTFTVAGRSVTCAGRWDDLLKVKSCKVKLVQINPSNTSSSLGPVNRGWHPFILIVEGDAARLRIPFKFIIAEVLENISLLIKTSKQLFYQFIRGGIGSILQPVVERPKKLPEIRIKFRIVCVQFEDDPFENKLNAIRRAGKEEVKDRLARDESFEQKIQALKGVVKHPSSHRKSRHSWESARHSDCNSNDSPRNDDNASIDSSHAGGTGILNSHVSITQAAQRLNEYNAAAWIKRMKNALAEQERQEDAIQRQLYGHGTPKLAHTMSIPMVPVLKATPLVRVVLNSIQISLYKADFEGEDGLMDYLHQVGRGLPKNTEFSLILPMHISWQMEGASIRLRDFPLYLFSLPRPQAQNGHQQERDLNQYTWQFESDFVVAEEMCGMESIRVVQSVVVPPHLSRNGTPYTLDIPKSVMPVKSYAAPSIRIKSTGPVQLGWGNSMQPTVQDMMRVLDSISKPPVDLSERVGFWDKVRLVLHWRVDISFLGSKADVVLHLKGSRDPYELLGSGAGFVKVWRGNVKLLLGHQNDEQEFLQIKSDQYILGIPNLKDLINNAATGSAPVATATPAANYKRVYQGLSQDSDSDESDPETLSSRETEFIKIVGKLTNGVRWGMGIVLERACLDSVDQKCNCQGSPFHRKCRIFTFKPHYKVVTKTPQFCRSPDGTLQDSYQDFRSDFIHFSISLTSPTDVGNRQKRPTGQNSLYFSAESFTHFWCWWKTFDSALALPIRQGTLFPSAQAASKKFGRHVATIKYRFGISPLFLAHTYRYESAPDWVHGQNIVIGLKAKISRFNVDLHSRAIETTIRKPEMKEPKKLIRKAFYEAEIECQDVEIRALSAVFQTPRKSAYANEIGLATDQDESETNSILEDHHDGLEFSVNPSGDEAACSFYSGNPSTKDMEWIDLNDFSDIFFWPNSSTLQQPKIKMFHCLSCPRISFLRRPSPAGTLQPQTATSTTSDWESVADGQPIERTKFGKEDTHTCFIGKAEDPMKVQVGLIDARLKELEEQKYQYLLRVTTADARPEDNLMLLQLEARMQTLREYRSTMLNANGLSRRKSSPEHTQNQTESLSDSGSSWPHGEMYLFEMANQIADENSEWTNRLLVHNPSILISNSIRDILLKYYYSSSQRRAFMYHLSARAVKFILDLADHESSTPSHKPKSDFNKRRSRMRSFDYQRFDGGSNSNMNSKSMPKLGDEDGGLPSPFRSHIEEQAEQDVPDDFILDPAYLVLLVRPQIAFRSEVDDVSTVILTAFHAQVKSFDVLDPSHIDDPVNALVVRRNFGSIKGFQMFYPCNTLSSSLHATSDQDFLVPLEVLVDLRLEPWGFDRLVGRCTVNLAHDTFNQLRIKRRSSGADSSFSSASQPHLQTSTDLLRVEMTDAVSVHATATHYRAIYNVITDLCLYIDPAQKKRNAALETMQFAYDVDDLAGMAEQIQQQQARIRIYRNKLNEEYVDLNVFDEARMADLTQCEYHLWMHASDLNLMVEAIRRSQASRLGRSKAEKLPGSQLSGHAKSITWHMLADSGEAIAKLSITDTRFESYTLPDTSVSNRLYVQDMLALNISADNDRQFDEILSRYEPYHVADSVEGPKHFLMVLWKTLPPIAGISIIESFLLEIHPVRLQVEHAIGVKVHEYLFAHKTTPVGTENGPDEHVHNQEISGFPISEGESKKLSKKRSMMMKFHQPNSRPETPDTFDEKRKLPYFSMTTAEDPGYDVPSSGRSRVNESLGFLNADWRSAFASGSSGSFHINRASYSPSVRSISSDGRRPGGAVNIAPTVLINWNKQRTEDATEMKKRAQLYKSFLFIDVVPTILCVSYSGPKYPDIFDLVVKVPPFHFESRTWSYSEFFDEIRRTCVASLFKQSPSILGQIITTARKNKSVPKLMGQKMASGLKLKKRMMFERGNSASSLYRSTNSNGASTSTSHQSSNAAGTSIDQGNFSTSQDTNLSQSHNSRSPYLGAGSSHSSEMYDPPSTKEAIPKPYPPRLFQSGNSPSLGNIRTESLEVLKDHKHVSSHNIHDFPSPNLRHSHDSASLPDQRPPQQAVVHVSQSRRQLRMRLSTSDVGDFFRNQSTRQRRQSEGPLTPRGPRFHSEEPLPANSLSFIRQFRSDL